ncbi:uncharacterized protein LOC107272957 [Cephus cinctus]|uniref:Uncharacterized protein LOC107272957 n=1 Tax=Cephus cinctus TaxID=211228 RepID=A0AAJ7CB35_CEPCN|nr:uncharacterized protein LOC107272957 [Cephus cinctus]
MCAFHINDLALQSIEFNVTKDLAAFGEIIFQQKQKSLLDKKRKLNELHLKVWNNENTICDDVWKFSQEHDFYTILKQYDDATEKRNEKIKHGRGKYVTDNEKKKIFYSLFLHKYYTDIEWVNISELNYEIEAIEQEIYYLTENDLKQKNLKEALKDLELAQRFSKENNDVKRYLSIMIGLRKN